MSDFIIKDGKIEKYNGNSECVYIPDGVEDISYAFIRSDNLDIIKEIIIPDSVQYVDGNPFEDCHNLCNIKVSSGNTSLCSIDGVLYTYDKEFLICCPPGYEKQQFVVPDGVVVIGEYAFNNCQHLHEITIPDTVTEIEDFAFECCNFQEVTIPKNVTSVGEGVFNNCKKLRQINVDSQNRNFSSDNGILYNYDKTILIRFPMAHHLDSFSVPYNVQEIADYAFSDCDLFEVNMPNTVRSIGDSAFYGCGKLLDVVLSENLTAIRDEAFMFCSSIRDLIIPKSVHYLGRDVFRYCEQNITLHIGKKPLFFKKDEYHEIAFYALLNNIKCIRDIR